jgi:AcrR family transcriptional regulator
MNVRELKINHILEKAFELFSKEGIDNVTMNNIADKAEIGVASLYRYFSTKEELAIQCATKMWQIEKEKANGFFTTQEYLEKSGIAQLHSILSYFEDSFDSTQDFYRFIYYFDSYIKRQNIESNNLKEYENTIQEITEIAFKSIEKGFFDGTISFPNENIQALTLTITHSVFSLAQKLSLSGGMLSQDISNPPKNQLAILKKLILASLSK